MKTTLLVTLVALSLISTDAVAADNAVPAPAKAPVAASAPKSAAQAAQAAPSSPERITIPEIPGYKVGRQETKGNVIVSEWVKENETIENWTELVIIQVVPGGAPKADPVAYAGSVDNQWKKACPGSVGTMLWRGDENGYSAVLFSEMCPKNPQTGRPEHAIVKAIRGTDNFYIVQKVWRDAPAVAPSETWSYLLGRVGVCDPRRPEAPCPKPSATAAKPPPTTKGVPPISLMPPPGAPQGPASGK